MLLLILSKRIHSIYMLRLFNDCVCVLLMYAAMVRFQRRRFMSATLFWGLAVSVKMSALLYAPAILVVLVECCGWINTAEMACWFGLLHGFLAVPFLRKAWREYVKQAFDFGRQFEFEWTVNWRFVGEKVFRSAQFQYSLLVGHVTVLLVFAHFKWVRGGLLGLFTGCSTGGSSSSSRSGDSTTSSTTTTATATTTTRWTPRRIALVLMECNLIGIVFARSLHYQHYSWYYHSAWMLALASDGDSVPLPIRVALCLVIEYCWNVFPSTPTSSLVLLLSNVALLMLPRVY
jgi:alpha-1,3-mannosyltransferase